MIPFRFILTVAFLSVLIRCFTAHAAEDRGGQAIPIAKVKHSGRVDFEKEILPVLKNNCLACHNQTKAKGGLVLETPQTILKGGDNGPAVVPQKPAESLLLKAAAHQDEEMIMPPQDNKVSAVPLKPEELGLIQLWIAEGAKGEVRAPAPMVWQKIPPGLKSIYALALTRDGQFAACGRGNQIFIYHLPTRQLAMQLADSQIKGGHPASAHRDVVNSLAFSHDGEWLASGGYREVKLWQRVPPNEKITLVKNTLIEEFAVSPDGATIALTTNRHLTLWSADGKFLRTVGTLSSMVQALNFSPNSFALGVACDDRSLTVFKTTEVHPGVTLQLTNEIEGMAWVGNSSIAAAGSDGVVRLFNYSPTNQQLVLSREFKVGMAGTALHSLGTNAQQVLVTDPEGTLRVWDLEKNSAVIEARHGAPILNGTVAANVKNFISAGSGTARLWKISDTKPVAELKGDHSLIATMAEKEREMIYARSETNYHSVSLASADTNRTAMVTRQQKATDTNSLLLTNLVQKQTAFTNATVALRDAEMSLDQLGPEVRKLLEALSAAEKAATNIVTTAKKAEDDKKEDPKQKALADAKAALENLPAEIKARQKLETEKMKTATKAVADSEKDLKQAELSKSNAENELHLAGDALQKANETLEKAKRALSESDTALKKAEAEVEQAKVSVAKSESGIRSASFSPDAKTIATLHDDGKVRLWNADTGEARETISVGIPPPEKIAWLAKGQMVCAGSNSVSIWETAPRWVLKRVLGTGDPASPISDRVNAITFTHDDAQLITSGGEPTRGGEIKVWKMADGKALKNFNQVHSDSVLALALSPDGKYLASGAADRFVKVIDFKSGKVAKTFEGHTHHVLGVTWRREGRTLLSAGADNVVKVWDFVAGERRKNIEGFSKEVASVAFVGVGDQALMAAGDGQVLLMTDKGEKLRTFPGNSDYVYAAASSADGKTIVGGGADGVLRVWGDDGKLISEFPSP